MGHVDEDVFKQVLERMKRGETMNKAATACGLRQSTVHARFKKHPELWKMVKQNEEDGDAEGDVEEEDEDEVLESLSRGRGRPLDLPAELEEVLAKEVERAIKERNAPSSYAVLKQLVRKTLSNMRARGFELETRFVDNKPSNAWVDRFLKRHRMRWKRASKLGEARLLAMTPGNVSFTFREWRRALVKVAFDMWRVYCWDQTPLETDLPRRVRFRAVGLIGSDQQPIVRGRTTIGSGFVVWLAIGCMGQVLYPVVIFKGGSDKVAEYEQHPSGKIKKLEQGDLAQDEEEVLDEADAAIVDQALRAENRELARRHEIPRRKKGRLARFAPAQFPIECNHWGFLKQPNGATDSYVAEEAFKFFVEQIERQHPDELWKVVVMDNLGAHRQPELLARMLDHHILPLFIYPNSTHRFMPLDRVFNGIFKHYYNSELRDCIGAGVMPNNRVILTCVSRALDHICPEVTKSSWRGFYPYDRETVVTIEEQRNALRLKRHIMDDDVNVDDTDTEDDLPDILRMKPRARPLPPRHLRRHRFAFEAFRPAAVEAESSSSEDDDDLDDMVANLDEVREEMAVPFRRQKLLGTSKKTFAAIGLITPLRFAEEQERMARFAEEERLRKEQQQAQRRENAKQRKAKKQNAKE